MTEPFSAYELKNKNIRLERVNIKNFGVLMRLSVTEEQKEFVASNIYSMAEAYANLSDGRFVQAFGIYDAEKPVGFAMIGHNIAEEGSPESVCKSYLLWRFMIDQRYQRQGYGRDAMKLILDYIRTFPDGEDDTVSTSYEPSNSAAKNLYVSCGFAPTGEMDEDEEVAVLKLK